MVEIVLHLVVLGQAPEVGGLNLQQVLCFSLPDADHR